MDKARGARGNPNGRGAKIVRSPGDTAQPPTLKELGVSKSQSSRWQQLALQPEPVFEAYVANTKGKAERSITTSKPGPGIAMNGKHYWLTPPDLMKALDREFNFDFDPCPYPRPDNFDGLTEEWGQSNYVNPPFEKVTAWVRKAIAENRKGKGVVLVLPVERWLHRVD